MADIQFQALFGEQRNISAKFVGGKDKSVAKATQFHLNNAHARELPSGAIFKNGWASERYKATE